MPSIAASQRDPVGTCPLALGTSSRATKVLLAASITRSTLRTVAAKRPPPTLAVSVTLMPA